MKIKHSLTLSRKNNATGIISQVYNVTGSTDYELNLIELDGVKIQVLKHLGKKLSIDEIMDVSNLTIPKSVFDNLHKEAIAIFNSDPYDFTFNCHTYTFLNGRKYWLNNTDSIKSIIDNIYYVINDDKDVQEEDIFIFIQNNIFVHSLIFKKGLYCHKIGPKGILHDPDLNGAKSTYPNCIINHYRKKPIENEAENTSSPNNEQTL